MVSPAGLINGMIENALHTDMPSFTPPVDPGRFTISVGSGQAGQPARQHRRRDARR